MNHNSQQLGKKEKMEITLLTLMECYVTSMQVKGCSKKTLVYHPDRLLYPMKRTRSKGDPDPGWQRISWDEALDLTAARLGQIAGEHGPESVNGRNTRFEANGFKGENDTVKGFRQEGH